MSVLLDIQAVQSPAHGERGIARYVLNVAEQLELRHPGLVSRYLLNPDLAVPGSIEPVLGTGRVEHSDRGAGSGARVYHVGSPIEYVPLERLLPAYSHSEGMRAVVTLYDLIPKLFPDVYLSNPATLAWYSARLELIRHADRVLAISESTARDAIAELGLPPERVTVVGAGVSERFRRPADRRAVLGSLAARMPSLEPGYVLYTGGIEPRKNIDRLLEAYAGLPRELRERHQLVIVCRVSPEERAALDKRLRKLGVAGRVQLTGFVADDELVALYQATELFVFPALYEGFGLPVAEAMACGAAVISSSTSSLPELVRDPVALFDPHETEAIRVALQRALEDEALRRRLREVELDERYTWAGVADRTAEVYAELSQGPRRPQRLRKRVAFVSPLPPARTGIADESYRLLAELRRHCDLDAFADQGEAEVPDDVGFEPIWRFDAARRARGGYDHVIVCLGNSEHHAEALALLRRQPAVVLAHDVRLTGLFAWTAAHRPDLEPRRFHEILQATYGGRLPPTVGAGGWIDVGDYDRHGVLLAREVIGLAERYLVHSRYAADLARLEAAPGDEGKIGVLPFGITAPDEFVDFPRGSEHPLVVSLGLVSPTKQPERLLAAFAELAPREPEAKLVFAGPVEEAELVPLQRLVESLGLTGRVEFTGALTEPEFYGWIARASVAVQLRAASNGETSGTVTRCLAAGVPVVVSAIGSVKELPEDCTVKLPRDVAPEELAAQIESLLRDGERRAALQEAGLRYAREHSFALVADRLWLAITEGDGQDDVPSLAVRFLAAEVAEALANGSLGPAAAAELIALRSRCEVLEGELAEARSE